MKTKIVKLQNRELEVKQLPLRRYSELLKALQELPKNLGGLENLNNDQIFERIPMLIAQSFPDLLNLLTIATDLTKEEIEADDFGLNEATDVVLAVMEVNDYKAIFEKVKKAMARPEEKPAKIAPPKE